MTDYAFLQTEIRQYLDEEDKVEFVRYYTRIIEDKILFKYF